MKRNSRSRSSVAYLDQGFLESDAARPVRILAEYLAPLETFRREQIRDTIVFFGSARIAPDGPLGRYYQDARTLARLVTTWSKGLPTGSRRYVVCSGGGPGIMEAANRGASEAAGLSIGLNIGLPHERRRQALLDAPQSPRGGPLEIQAPRRRLHHPSPPGPHGFLHDQRSPPDDQL